MSDTLFSDLKARLDPVASTYPPCPVCGRIDWDLWEYREGTQSMNCGLCDAPLVLTVETTTTYSLVKAEP